MIHTMHSAQWKYTHDKTKPLLQTKESTAKKKKTLITASFIYYSHNVLKHIMDLLIFKYNPTKHSIKYRLKYREPIHYTCRYISIYIKPASYLFSIKYSFSRLLHNFYYNANPSGSLFSILQKINLLFGQIICC